MSEPTLNETRAPNGAVADERDRERRRPSPRNRTIYERRVLGGETLAALAIEYNVTHQRIAQITTRVEGWIAGHPEDQLASRLRLRCRLRYEALYESAVTGFADSRKEEVTVKQRKTTRAAKRGSPDVVLGSAEERPSAEPKATDARPSAERKATWTDEDREDAKPEEVVTVEERIVRQRHGDPRLLATAMKAVEKLERFAASLDRENDGFRSPEAGARKGVPQPRRHAEPVRRDPISTLPIRETEPGPSGVGGHDSWVSEESPQQANVANADTSSLATRHSPLATPSLPPSPATHHSPPATPDPGVGIHGSGVKAGVRGRDSGVGEETPQQAIEANATAASLATLHSPLTTSSATRPKHILIVGHYKSIDRMSDLAQSRLPGFHITPTCYASIAKEWIEKHVREAAVIWLENDLGPRREEPGGTITPGTGCEVAMLLAEARPRCRVLVNAGDDCDRPLCTVLEDAGCSVEEVFHKGGDWLRDNWLCALRRALRLPEDDEDFDFENEDYGDEDDFEDE